MSARIASTAVPLPLAPVQLTLQLCAPHRPGAPRISRPRQPYWTHIDLADLGGGELQARNHTARVSLNAQPAGNGLWTGYYDALFSQSGVSGPTRPLPSRQNALSMAAHAVLRHCRSLIISSAASPRADVRAAKEIIRSLGADRSPLRESNSRLDGHHLPARVLPRNHRHHGVAHLEAHNFV